MGISVDQIKKLIGEKDEIVIFEVGCADGRDTKQFLQKFGDNLKIYTFDPEPINIKSMTELGSTNCVGDLNDDIISDPRHIFHPYAMSDTDGKVTFYRSRDTGYEDKGYGKGRYSGSIHKPVDQLKGWPHIVFDESVEVETRSLDSFCKEHKIKHIDFLWMDTQGAEAKIFQGGKKTLKNVDYVYTEYYNQDMYENQVYFDELEKLLSNFKLIANWKYVDYAYPECNGGDALFVRNDLEST